MTLSQLGDEKLFFFRTTNYHKQNLTDMSINKMTYFLTDDNWLLKILRKLNIVSNFLSTKCYISCTLEFWKVPGLLSSPYWLGLLFSLADRREPKVSGQGQTTTLASMFMFVECNSFITLKSTAKWNINFRVQQIRETFIHKITLLV
jgi:hypothetical protein